jgi:hypothetical protein
MRAGSDTPLPHVRNLQITENCRFLDLRILVCGLAPRKAVTVCYKCPRDCYRLI